MDCAVGVMAYNEEANISQALVCLCSQQTRSARLSSITVVASGCTDRTAQLVRSAASGDPRIRLLELPVREGKAAAVRAFLASLSGEDVVVLAGADTRPRPGALEALLRPFADAAVGMTGGRPIPLNPRCGLANTSVHALWRLHHEVSLLQPKMGELVAFRNILPDFPTNTAVDEATVEQTMSRAGYRIVYVPEAEVEMRGPDTLREFFRQRRRIHAGHLSLFDATRYRVASGRPRVIARALRSMRGLTAREWAQIGLAALIEWAARALGRWDHHVAGRDHVVWRVAPSTKSLGEGAGDAAVPPPAPPETGPGASR